MELCFSFCMRRHGVVLMNHRDNFPVIFYVASKFLGTGIAQSL
jgi:hypothetical protein